MKNHILLLLTALLCTPLSGQINDTIPFPANHSGDVRVINFYQNYKSKPNVQVHLTINSSPNNAGENWYTIYAEGTLNWLDPTTLEGNLGIMFDSKTKVVGSLLSELFQDEVKRVKLEINTTNGKASVTDDEFYIYPTEIKNNTIYGFNNSNKTLIISFENP